MENLNSILIEGKFNSGIEYHYGNTYKFLIVEGKNGVFEYFPVLVRKDMEGKIEYGVKLRIVGTVHVHPGIGMYVNSTFMEKVGE